MSWSDRCRVFAVLALAATTAGCFQPLYGEAAHPGLVQALREVEVTPIPERMGHYLSDDLISRLNGSGETRFERPLIECLAALAGFQKPEQIRRARQAADMGRQDPV